MKNFFYILKNLFQFQDIINQMGFYFFFIHVFGVYQLSNKNILEVYHLCIIFFLGSCGMRALGCIWNDFNDKKFDILVKEQKIDF